MDKLLLRPAEAAELLGVGRSQIYSLLATGELPSVRVGHSVRVPVGALKEWVATRAHGTEATVGSKGEAGQ
jgi:excisionase family DNA binding protein